MKKLVAILLFSIVSFSQTKNTSLNQQLKEMNNVFFKGDYKTFLKYTYPKVIEMMGGNENFIKITTEKMKMLKNDGFNLIKITYKNPSNFFTKNNELQCSLIQEILIDTPKGRILAEYTIIAISSDGGNNWTFLDTSGKSKSEMLGYFPNLSSDLIIIDKTQKFIN